MRTTLTFPLGAAAASALLVSGCSASAQDNPLTDPTLTIAAAFYPLQFVAERVGGEAVAVETLTAPGVEPHDLEMSPAAVRDLQDVDTVLYLSEFQPAVDAAIETTGARALDAHEIVAAHESEHAAEDATEDDEDAAHDDHDHGAEDPHFWLDPTALAAYAQLVADELSALDPEGAGTYAENAQALITDLTVLDESFTQGLDQCEREDIFVSHEAFGYLTERYGLHQEGLSGLDPEAEPSPARVREIRDAIGDSGATTVYSESLVDASAVEALAADAGVDVAVLDPVEGVADKDDYLGVMERNLQALRDGLGCA